MLQIELQSMASLARYSTSPYWIACFRDYNRKQRRRSTRETNRKRAQQIADTLEQVSKLKMNARRIREAVNEIYRQVSGESLPHSSVKTHAAIWLGQKKLECKPASYELYQKGYQQVPLLPGRTRRRRPVRNREAVNRRFPRFIGSKGFGQ